MLPSGSTHSAHTPSLLFTGHKGKKGELIYVRFASEFAMPCSGTKTRTTCRSLVRRAVFDLEWNRPIQYVSVSARDSVDLSTPPYQQEFKSQWRHSFGHIVSFGNSDRQNGVKISQKREETRSAIWDDPWWPMLFTESRVLEQGGSKTCDFLIEIQASMCTWHLNLYMRTLETLNDYKSVLKEILCWCCWVVCFSFGRNFRSSFSLRNTGQSQHEATTHNAAETVITSDWSIKCKRGKPISIPE